MDYGQGNVYGIGKPLAGLLFQDARGTVLDVSGGVSPKDIDNALRAYGLQSLGYDNASGFIGTLERRGMLGRVQAARARKAIREAAGDSKISHADNLTAELDARVREVSVYAR